MNYIIKLTDVSDNKPIYIVADKILYIRLVAAGTFIQVGAISITVMEPIPLVMALLENRDTLAARILYDRPKTK